MRLIDRQKDRQAAKETPAIGSQQSEMDRQRAEWARLTDVHP
jgi:hypothetical protein